jgi:hypothetical protein
METTKMPQSCPSRLGMRLRQAATCVLLPAMALGLMLGCGAGTNASAPTVTGFTPGYGNAFQETSVIVYGTGFSQGLQNVYFGGAVVAAGRYTGLDTQVTVTVPAAAVTGDISVTTSGGSAGSPSEFIVVPYVSGTVGTSTVLGHPAGGIGTTVTISGQGLSGTGVGPITMQGTGGLLTITPTTQKANEIIFTIPEGITPDTQDGADPNTITINNNYALGADAAPVLIVFDVP